MKKKLLILILFITANCFSQFSKTHYIPPLSNSEAQQVQGQFLYVSSPSLTDVNFKIIQLGGITINGTVSRDNPYTLNIGTGTTQLFVNRNSVGGTFTNKGYIIEAENLVYVTVRFTTTPQNFQAGGLVSKGLAALGTQFRVGAFTNTSIPQTDENHYTFASILATENNTLVQFDDIDLGVTLVNNFGGNNPADIILNQGESYIIAVEGPITANRDGLIGMLIKSDKPIAVNCGSIAGTNGDASNLDVGIDQIVSAERTGKEYIFIKGNGMNVMERPLIVAHEDDTDVFLNGDATPFTTLNAGEYIAIDGSSYSLEGNLFVNTSKNVFAYQGLGGTVNQANQNMHFVPPLSCETPKIINNIPFINQIGFDNNYNGTVCVVTQTGAELNFIINGSEYTLDDLPGNILVNGPISVTGSTNYVTYTFNGLSGNISVFSTKQVYVSYFGSSGAATYGGFYSGFTFKPEISFERLDPLVSNCIPNINLSVSELAAFDTYQWYLNDIAITGATDRTFTPSQPGFYNVIGKITECNIELASDKIPVSSCPTDIDNDSINDNIDPDNDNDTISNCDESYGNLDINLSDTNAGSINIASYNNSFTGTTSNIGMVSPQPFIGNTNGSFVSEILAGFDNSLTQTFNFNQPISLTLEYITIANPTDLLSSNDDFIIQVPVDKTLTILNPDGQLLIDTNYDGIFESGITEHSSFQIRFRLNNAFPLPAGTGTFKIQAYLVDSFSYTHKNLSGDENSKATFKLIATCIPKDNDSDGIPDQVDYDSDNDGITDLIEASTILDPDFDSIPNYYDLDSDNDGIYDLVESGSNAIDLNSDGAVDGIAADFGSNGLLNMLEDTTDIGLLNYTITDTDENGLPNFIALDSDADGCFDVIEAGFSDGNNDGKLGDNFPTTNSYGIVTNGTGYTTPNGDYIISAPIVITTQAENQSGCISEDITFSIDANADEYQWQVSTDGNSFMDITDDILYTGSTTSILQINNVTLSMNGYKYRVLLKRNGNACNITTTDAILTVFPLPIVVSSLDLVQCDDDTDGFTDFNLKEKESEISTNFTNETFTYYSTLNGAENADNNFLIANPLIYNNSNGNTVWVRIVNSNSCYAISQLDLIVSATQLPSGFSLSFAECDDFIADISTDNDGTTVFDFSSATNDIYAELPNATDYTIKYYINETDALVETDVFGNSLEIMDISSYRNTSSPDFQQIWVRVENTLQNGCYALGPYINLTVNPLPDLNLQNETQICTGDINQIVVINAGLQSGNISDFNYQWSKEGQIINGATSYTYSANQEGNYSTLVTNIATGCFRTSNNTLVSSQKATIDDIIITDLSDNNTFEVIVSGNGIYEFSLDYEDGPYQSSPFFENVQSGIHTIFVNDLKGCGIVSKIISIVGAQKFFTPNGDGYNDFWKINGINPSFNFYSTIYIFDRYGKLLKQIPPGNLEGWDGTYEGQIMPADDYWYTLDLEDGRAVKGHFSLKR